MIIKKVWLQTYKTREWQRSGWYLLGFIPLYIRDDQPRGRIEFPDDPITALRRWGGEPFP